jgi:hypothetical protein
MVTVTEPEIDPAAMLICGLATMRVYVAEVTLLAVSPLATAIALSANEFPIATGALYTFDEVVGVVPLRVK